MRTAIPVLRTIGAIVVNNTFKEKIWKGSSFFRKFDVVTLIVHH
jgi:hypothetical protein